MRRFGGYIWPYVSTIKYMKAKRGAFNCTIWIPADYHIYVYTIRTLCDICWAILTIWLSLAALTYPFCAHKSERKRPRWQHYGENVLYYKSTYNVYTASRRRYIRAALMAIFVMCGCAVCARGSNKARRTHIRRDAWDMRRRRAVCWARLWEARWWTGSETASRRNETHLTNCQDDTSDWWNQFC